MTNKIYFGDNLEILKQIPDQSIPLIYIDPPFNTGKKQERTQIKTVRDPNGSRKGFMGTSYSTERIDTKKYSDSFDDYEAFIRPRLEEAYRVLAPNGSLYFHIDYREAHYCKIWLDEIFGRECFINEIIWAYDYGGKPKNKWPAKHDTILFYVKDPENYYFKIVDDDREPYMAPGLVGPEKAARGKLPTDTWWWSIVGTNSKERNGYPTQKPLGIINRIIRTSSQPGDVVIDFFAGSGTVGESCLLNDRKFILMDNNPEAIDVMKNRFQDVEDIEWINLP
jgi:site-specific DNA-methyltransferase (adenine-specific)